MKNLKPAPAVRLLARHKYVGVVFTLRGTFLSGISASVLEHAIHTAKSALAE